VPLDRAVVRLRIQGSRTSELPFVRFGVQLRDDGPLEFLSGCRVARRCRHGFLRVPDLHWTPDSRATGDIIDELQLGDGGRRKDERVRIGVPEPAIQVVQHVTGSSTRFGIGRPSSISVKSRRRLATSRRYQMKRCSGSERLGMTRVVRHDTHSGLSSRLWDDRFLHGRAEGFSSTLTRVIFSAGTNTAAVQR
jgi:hypothetical protein